MMQNNLKRSMKSLCFSGCSITWGDELKNRYQERYSTLVSKHYNYRHFNLSACGISNDSIVRSTINTIQNTKPDIVVIQFTVHPRIEYFTENDTIENWTPQSLTKFSKSRNYYVSLYNETDGEPILPTPTIGAVGLLNEDEEPILNSINSGDLLLVVGETSGHLGQSAIVNEMFGLQGGAPPNVDLIAEKQNGYFILNNRELINACTDLSDGGIALAAFELAEMGNIGMEIDISDTDTLFGEDQARYIIASNFDQAEALFVNAREAGVVICRIGTPVSYTHLTLPTNREV